MKKSVLLLALILPLCGNSAMLNARPGDANPENQKTVGKVYSTGTDIKADTVDFPEAVWNIRPDSLSQSVNLFLRAKSKDGRSFENGGRIASFDPLVKKEKWSTTINYSKSNVYQYGNIILQVFADKTDRLNETTGEKQWETNDAMFRVEKQAGRGLCYETNFMSGPTNNLLGVDLSDGKTVWKRKINREYGWNDALLLNDSTLLIAASGIHTVNLYTGKGWNYEAVTGAKDLKAAVGASYAAGVMGGAIGGAIAGAVSGAISMMADAYSVATPSYVIRDLASNFCLEGTNIYFASKEKIAKLDSEGKVLWQTSLPKGTGSKSRLSIKNGTIYMINFGCALRGTNSFAYGKPFVAAFDAETGKQLFLNEIDRKKDPVKDMEMNGNSVFLMFKNDVSEYSLSDGSLVSNKTFGTGDADELLHFADKQKNYVKTDSGYSPLSTYEAGRHYLFQKNNKILVIDDRLENIKTMAPDDLYEAYSEYGKYRLLGNGKQTSIIDGTGKGMAEIEGVGKYGAVVFEGRVYYRNDRTLFIADLSDCLKP